MKLLANKIHVQGMTVLLADKVHEQEPQCKRLRFIQPWIPTSFRFPEEVLFKNLLMFFFPAC